MIDFKYADIKVMTALRKFCEEHQLIIYADSEARVKIVINADDGMREYVCYGSFDARTKQLKTQEWVELL